MKFTLNKYTKLLIIIGLLLFSNTINSQDSIPKPKSEFWKKVSFIPSIGLGFGSGYSNVTLAPAAVYKINKYVSAGLGLQYNYFKQKNAVSSSTYGGSIIGLVNPIEELQISAEIEQLRANVKNEFVNSKADFWNTAAFIGAGYRFGNSVMGLRYNLLFDENDGIYGDALIPFVRIAF